MRKLTIGLDLDSCMSYFLESFLYKYNFVYDDDVKPKDITDWDIHKFLKCTKQEMYNLWNHNFIENVPVREGAKKLIQDIKSRGHRVVIATSYGRSMCEDKVNWCEKHLGLSEDEIIFIRKKHLLKLDVLLDDYLGNFKDEYGVEIEAEKVVMDAPYNKNSFVLGFHYRISKLNELIGIIDLIAKK